MKCYLEIGVVGLSFKTADLKTREEFHLIAKKIEGERSLFFRHPTILLTTCNRTEIYFSASDLAEAHIDLLSFLSAKESLLYAYFGIHSFSHLSRVTAGLDSAIVAETEIQRQVKLAYAKSSLYLALPSCMHYVFQKSLRIAKLARAEFPQDIGASLYGTLYDLAIEHFQNLQKLKILFIGYSEMSRGFATFLRYRGHQNFYLATRQQNIEMEGATLLSREILPSWMRFDWIIASAKADSYLIEGQGNGQLIFDLAIPRNVDPNIKGTRLFNIEEIDRIVEQKRSMQSARLQKAEEIVETSVHRYAKLYRAKQLRQLAQ